MERFYRFKFIIFHKDNKLSFNRYAKTLANEHARDTILVNVVCPGPTLTDRVKELISKTVQEIGRSEKEVQKAWSELIPLGRLGKPEELANLIVFLSSEKASFITGMVMQVDGGFVRSSL